MDGFLFTLSVVVPILVVIVVVAYLIDRDADANDSG